MNWDKMLGDSYFQHVQDRLYGRTEPLVWPQQVSDILFPSEVDETKVLVEAGCCMGTAWKTFKQRYKNLRYVGLDFTPRYIEEAKKYFADDPNCRFAIHDIVKPFPVVGDYVVCSACLEHIHFTDGFSALDNLIKATKEHLVLRTFLGDEYRWFVSGVGLPIQQFAFKSILTKLNDEFVTKVYRDRYTDSIPQLVQGAIRTFYVISARRR